MSANKALQNDTVWACVKLISQSISTLPLHVYKRKPNGEREVAKDYWLYDLIHKEPNKDMTSCNFIQSVVASLLLWGNAYIYKTYNTLGNKIISLDLISPENVSVIENLNGDLSFEYYTKNRQKIELNSKNCMHLKGFSLDGKIGLSVIQYAAGSIGGVISAEKASEEVVNGASRATGVINAGVMLKPDHREQIRKHVQTVGKEGGVYVLEAGMSFNSVRTNSKDMELISTRNMGIETICRLFNVPPVMIGHGEKNSSWPSSIEAQGTLFVRNVLLPFLVSIEQGIKRSLIPLKDSNDYFCEFSAEGLLRGDSAARAAFYSSALKDGWMVPDTVCQLENLPKVEGGDKRMIPAGVMPYSELSTMLQLDINKNPKEVINE
jgi:HK97 family phage portal protein